MKELNGDWLIEIMSQEEHSDEVLDLLEICKLNRIKFKPGGVFSEDIRIKEFGIKLNFSEGLNSEKQRAKAEEGNVYLQGVSFYEDCTISLPFGLQLGDSRVVATKKISENAKILHIFRHLEIDSILLEDKDKIYFFKPGYRDDSRGKLTSIVAFVWDIDMDLNKNYMPVKISIEEALKG